MPKVLEVVEKVRSKNAGPFWLTVDIFCGHRTVYEDVCKYLDNEKICDALHLGLNEIQRFEIASLNVIKFSFPRPQVQGSPNDRDMHGASWASLIYDIELY